MVVGVIGTPAPCDDHLSVVLHSVATYGHCEPPSAERWEQRVDAIMFAKILDEIELGEVGELDGRGWVRWSLQRTILCVQSREKALGRHELEVGCRLRQQGQGNGVADGIGNITDWSLPVPKHILRGPTLSGIVAQEVLQDREDYGV